MKVESASLYILANPAAAAAARVKLNDDGGWGDDDSAIKDSR